jgi:hypothetical protein
MLLLLSASLKCIYFKIICNFFCMLYVKAKPWFILFWVCSRNTLLWKDFSCFRRLILSLSWKSNDRGGLKFWTCLHATVLLAVKYSAELNKYILLVRVFCEKYRFRGQLNVPRHKSGSGYLPLLSTGIF